MRCVVAPDSFKESMTAVQAAQAMADGVQAARPDAQCLLQPMADGGEGFVDAVSAATGAELVEVGLHDALGRPTTGQLAIAGSTAIIEVAQAVGLGKIALSDRDIMASNSRGVGELIEAALARGVTALIVGLGGSATNDGGAGMLATLGVHFLNTAGCELEPTPIGLRGLARIDATRLDARLAAVQVEAACDVTNPLLGPEGASAIFGPQKGASARQIAELDAMLANLVVLSPQAARSAAELSGAGAAGGLGWALMGYLGASLRPGVELVAEVTGLDAAVAGADVVFTGEGSVDTQTLRGKTAAGVAGVARRHGVPVIVFAGQVQPGAEALLEQGVAQLVPIMPAGQALPEALRQGPANLRAAVADWLQAHAG